MTIVIKHRNVNGLYSGGMRVLANYGRPAKSRAGDVVVMEMPVMSVYEHPQERVLFDANRDANPFFHLLEGLHMLAGRDDAAFLNHYVSDFGEKFAEETGHIHGAYGHRWRSALGFDQLSAVVKRLRSNPDDRQCVLQMWDAREEQHGCDDLRGEFRDRPCNTHLYLRTHVQPSGKFLDMTVCCRSNDIVWGAYGANAVHMSMLLEYLAGRVDARPGRMYQLSNNFHGYVQVLDKLGDPGTWTEHDPYECGEVYPMRMGTNWEAWDADLQVFVNAWHDSFWGGYVGPEPTYVNAWFRDVAAPAVRAYKVYRDGRDVGAALMLARCIEAPDWRRACVEWLERRRERRAARAEVRSA